MTVIVDYGVGNLASIANMLKRVGFEARISSREEDLRDASHLVLPGVGAFDTCMSRFHDSGLLPVLKEKVLDDKTPLLGICVGMQMLLEESAEGKLPGLGWVPGKLTQFDKAQLPPELRIPHMGWSEVHLKRPSRLFDGLGDDARFYFVHSYKAELSSDADVSVTAKYGDDFVAGFENDNILGVQFHPEKSHKFGMKLFENFIRNY
jgi:glutamine amidotransferase